MSKISRIILLAILALLLLPVGCSNGAESSVVRVGELAPDFQAQNLDGQTISLSSLRGKPVLLNFWATWCPPCREEMPYLQQIYEEWSGKGLIVLAINTDESPSKVRGFLESHGFSFPVLLDADLLVALRYNVVRYNKLYIPTTFFIDRDGIVRKKVIGAFRSKEQIEEYLTEIIP